YKVHTRIHRVTQVIHTVDLDHINVLRVEPVAGPRAAKSKPITAVLEAATAEVALANAKRVFASEVGLVTLGWNAATVGVLFLLFRPSLPSTLLRILLLRPGVLFFLSSFFFLLCWFFWLRFLLFFLGRLVFLFFLLVLLLCVGRSRKD